jgi:uncharacterized protein (TIGR02217 family)
MIDPVVFPLQCRRLSGATSWRTHIQDGRSGHEVRNAEWQDSLRRFDCGPSVKTLTEQAVVENWHMACNGAAIGFLLRDLKDYQATHVATMYTGGSSRQGVMTCLNPGTDTLFRLELAYSNGYRTHRRRITRPQAGTVVLYDGDGFVIGNGYELDTTTGLVEFDNEQTVAPTWDGNFYVPVRFESDDNPFDIIRIKNSSGTGVGEVPEIVLLEVRE